MIFGVYRYFFQRMLLALRPTLNAGQAGAETCNAYLVKTSLQAAFGTFLSC